QTCALPIWLGRDREQRAVQVVEERRESDERQDSIAALRGARSRIRRGSSRNIRNHLYFSSLETVVYQPFRPTSQSALFNARPDAETLARREHSVVQMRTRA